MADHQALNEFIDARLRERRPDRYPAGADFIKEVAAMIPEDMLSPQEALAILALDKVQGRETESRKRANRLLRKFGEDGQLELDWWDSASDPIAVPVVNIIDGNESKTTEYVALRAATAEDLLSWQSEERDRARKDYVTRLATCKAAATIADEMTRGGFRRFSDWGEARTAAPSDSIA